MILLTDDELRAGLDDTDKAAADAMCLEYWYVVEVVAEAQLKKVVEWGNGHCPHAGPPDDDPTQEKKHCNACWRTLKEEAGV